MFDPELFLAQARRLAQAGGEEDYRSAVSRAYCACHLIARDQLFGVDARRSPTRKRPSHQAVIAAVHDHPRLSDFAKGFQQLKLAREMADYVRDPQHPEIQDLFRHYSVSAWEALANEALSLATDLLPSLRALAPRA